MQPNPPEGFRMHLMPRDSVRRARFSKRAAAMLVTVVLAGCAIASKSSAPPRRFDLGSAAPNASTGARLPTPARWKGELGALKVLSVGATPSLNTDRIRYRFAFADIHEVREYTQSRFTMAPVQLFAQRLQASLAARGAVLQGDDAVKSPLLKIELLEFSQVFTAPGQSVGVVTLRASLISADRLLGQRGFDVARAAPSADAAGAVAALATASDAAIAQIVQWLEQQPALHSATNATL